jgi:hypothetical protein
MVVPSESRTTETAAPASFAPVQSLTVILSGRHQTWTVVLSPQPIFFATVQVVPCGLAQPAVEASTVMVPLKGAVTPPGIEYVNAPVTSVVPVATTRSSESRVTVTAAYGSHRPQSQTRTQHGAQSSGGPQQGFPGLFLKLQPTGYGSVQYSMSTTRLPWVSDARTVVSPSTDPVGEPL